MENGFLVDVQLAGLVAKRSVVGDVQDLLAKREVAAYFSRAI
jgi:hypothetical protein